MKSEDLQIGDWIFAACTPFNGEERQTPPMRVVAIGETWVHLLIDPEAGDPDEYDIEDIRPIPLTAEILVANGWEHTTPKKLRKKGLYSDESLRFAVDAEIMRNDRIYVDLWTLGYSIKLPIDYIHKLQHVLRIAGVDMNIVLHSDN